MGTARTRTGRLVSLALVGGLVAGLAGCAADEGPTAPVNPKPEGTFPTEIAERLDAALETAMDLSGSIAAIAGVWAPWAGTWESAAGKAAPSGGDGMSTDMRFRIGTNTKAMTCTVLLELVDEKVVALDDEVSAVLTDTLGITGMTYRHLCQNTGGIGDYSRLLSGHFVNNPTRVWPALELYSAGLPLDRTGEPGAGFAPSNTGFILLGMALKDLTGKSWPQLYQEYILEPVGMPNTSFPGPEDLTIPGAHPDGFAYQVGPKNALQCDTLLDETALSASMFGVAGGAISTLDDSRNFVEAVANGTLLSPEAHAAQWETVPLGDKAPEWRGYGLGVEQIGPLRGSAGVIPGFLSVMLSDPESGLTLVVSLNNSSAGADFAMALGRQLAAIAAEAPSSNPDAPAAPTLPWTEEDVVAELTPMAVCQPEPEPEPEKK